MNLTQLTGPFIGTVVLAIVFTLMWRIYRERYLGLWAIASVLWVVRYLYAWSGGGVYLLPNHVVLPLIAVATRYVHPVGRLCIPQNERARGMVVGDRGGRRPARL